MKHILLAATIVLTLLSGCKNNEEITINTDHTCSFTDGNIKGTLSLCDDNVSLKVFEYNSDTLQLSISLNETNYTISNGKYSTTNGFCESTELPPLILMCKEYLDFSYKNCNNKNIIKTKNGYIEEINVDSIIYKFYEHKSTSVK